MKLISIEDQIIKATIKALLDAGYMLSVNDGEVTTVIKSVDKAAIFEAMKTTDEDYLLVHARATGWRRIGWVRFIYGNGETDVINDYTVNLEPIMVKITALIDEYEKGNEPDRMTPGQWLTMDHAKR